MSNWRARARECVSKTQKKGTDRVSLVQGYDNGEGAESLLRTLDAAEVAPADQLRT